MTDAINRKSLQYHRKLGGKIEIRSKSELADKEELSLIYTPGVGAVSEAIAASPDTVYDYTMKQNSVAIITDGSAILGLGNLGPEAAIPVMEGKAALFKKFAGINAFPLCLATQDPDEIVQTIVRVSPIFGGVNLEDIAAPRCFAIEQALRKALFVPVMHDDQHGTATVVLAGLLNALKVKNLSKEEARIVINGAGAAGNAIARILIAYGFAHMVICDSRGTLYPGREHLDEEKASLAHLTNPLGTPGNLASSLKKADIFIGVSKGNVLTPEMIGSMRPRPVIFALANPVPEIMPQDALRAGAFVVATGRSDFPNQINNVLAFPGIFRGALDHRIAQFEEAMFIRAAEALAALVEHPAPETLLPSVFDKRVVPAVAEAIKTRL